ncbi:C2 domain, partial [Dillenia turbinata]
FLLLLFTNADVTGGMDTYVLIQYKSQEGKSSVAIGQGRSPEWNENFTFRIDYPGEGDEYKLNLIIMEKDTFTRDEFVGQAEIYLKDLLELGIENGKYELEPIKYRVIRDGTYHGEIRVGVNFTAMVEDGEEYGGWKQSFKEDEEEAEEENGDILMKPNEECHHKRLDLEEEAQELLMELAMVEEEIIRPETKIEELKLNLCEERELTLEWELPHIHEKK